MKAVDAVCAFLAVVAGAILAGLVGLTFVDVFARYILLAPIFGATDVLQIGMAAVISLALPHAWRTGGHIVVDLLPDYRSPAVARSRDIAVRLVAIVLFAILADRAWIRAEDAELFNEATNQIEIPFRPFFLTLSFAAAFKVLVLSIEAVRIAVGLSIESGTAPSETTDVDEPAT